MTGRLLVTGVDGFVGRHLAQVATSAGVSVVGVARSPEPPPSLAGLLESYISADLRDAWPAELPTDVPIIHLAGLAAVGPSFDEPQEYIAGNSAMVTNMCEALLAAGSTGARVVGVSTGAVYAQNDERPARRESDPVDFTSPYVVSKVLVENQLTYYRRRGVSTVIARPFNHIGPGQGPGFLLPDLLDRLRTSGGAEPLLVGNLATRRDYTDVRDVARAYLALARAPVLDHQVYNVASGRALSGAELLDLLCEAMGRPRPTLRTDASRVRATDPMVIIGDAERITTELGWHPVIPIDRTVRDTVATAEQSATHAMKG